MFSHIHAGETAGRSSRLVSLPSVSVLAWIPRCSEREEFPEDLQPYSNEKWLQLIFESGNPQPPNSFRSHREFEKYLRFREFRAATAIANPQVILNNSGGILGVAFEAMAKVGFTPLRGAGLTYHSPGTGSHDYKIWMEAGKVEIDLWLRFKIGQIGDLAGFLLTGHRAPSALIRIIYIFFSGGEVNIHVFGSRIPSFTVYIDWKQKCCRNEWKRKELDTFTQTGKCRDAKLSAIYAARLEI